ncbi:hypothetical protein SAMN05216276_103562 [Streptosporangium subroseum]|uniref:DUF2264 domain-containing protein n=1 Tax=Streptosporangium subroseum TaxID=106412 RepID=A0A239LV97_9ACTN|nr:DUF2264 domain-containing protein [Streptosporangium subroseum]SNT34295.1 hypothetical protein SAMN05216276_103562 [Streptosporangium subroseum]
MLSLPPEDRSLSPYTGWTRAHWEALADGLLTAVEPYRSADGATIRLPGRASWSDCDGLEGFARTFLIAAFRVAGGGPAELLEPYRRGFVSGPGVWPAVADRFQPMVEAASLALGLWLTREQLWDTLGDAERERLGAYLATVFHHEPAPNNWWLFPVTVGGFLAGVGIEEEAARAAIERGLARIEDWYVGDGWYTDGDNRGFDHYNGWALHFYPVLSGLLSGAPRPEHESRLRTFLESYALMFGANGEPLYQGRSMTYRFATLASLMLGAVTGRTPLSPGATRRLASGSVRYFLEHDALSAENLMTLGWFGQHEATLQSYSGSASPYWAAKAFVGLLAPADHPLWTAIEEPGPVGPAALEGPGLVVQNRDGVARVLNHGIRHDRDDPLYDRYAYSTHTGPTTAADVPDNHFGLVGADGAAAPRGVLKPGGAGRRDEIAWAASITDGVESVSVLRGTAEVRVHRVAAGSRVRQTGWALPRATAEIEDLSVALTAPDGLRSRLTGLYGYDTAAALEAVEGTAFGSPALVPALDGVTEDGWAVSLAVLGYGDDPVDVHVEVDVDRVAIVWPDDERFIVTSRDPQE